ncbi:MAG TPA: hypothetical protein VFY73_10330 [Ideonella sp.]|uniref:hypothetical protein n=1 Tax=Ideonella sp. TaxID=1929293 RepID=UPI002E316355|nr:hypothetical protein [Ideonella sp.]HEX5684415.1 hypothetical protein [Ideonella sp.]
MKPDIVDRVGGGWHAATASLQLTAHPQEDIGLLGDIQAIEANAGWMGITVRGALDA